MSLALNAAEKRRLRGLAHPLNPRVRVGSKGLTRALIAELDIALELYELLKVRLALDNRASRDAAIAELLERSGTALVQRIGNVVTLYRPSRDRSRSVLVSN